MTDSDWLVPLSDVDVDDVILEAVREVTESGWWSMGPRVAEFEQAFAAFCEAEHAFAVASGTAALHLALLACGCDRGAEVILPSLNFVAAANTVLHAGTTPVFCDIEGSGDLNLDPHDLEAAVTERTKAVIVLHYGGFPCEMAAVERIAERYGLAVIEDAAHAPGASVGGRPCGSTGTVGCFSFFSNKNLPVGEGGMVVTSDDALAERVRLLRSHGMTTLTWDRHRGHAHSYDVVEPGFNFRLDELRAAIGLVQLSRLRAANARRADIAARYRAALHGTEGLTMPFDDAGAQARSSHHLAVVVLPAGVPRAQVRQALAEQRIQTSVHYPPIHRFSAYEGRPPSRPLPRTDGVADRLLTLPLFPHLRDDQLQAVISGLVAAVRRTRAAA